VENIKLFWNTVFDAAWVIELLLTILAWTILCRKKGHWISFILETIGLFLVTAIGSVGLFGIIGMSSPYPLYSAMLKAVVAWGYMQLFAPYQKRTRVLLQFAMFNAMLSITALSGQCSILVGKYVASGIPEGTVRCIIHILIPVTAIYLRRFDFDEISNVPGSCMQLVGVMCGGIFVVSIAEAFLISNDSVVVIAFMAAYFCLVVTSLVAIRAIYTMCSEQRDILELQAEKQRFQTEREMTQLAQSTLDDLRCIRHDLKNQYSYMGILLQSKRYDELAEYFQKMKNNLPEQLNLIDCGNHTMNTVLNMEFSRLRSRKITVEHKLVVPPVLPFADGDLCSIVANLLDNAGDECSRLMAEGKTDAKVRIEIYPHQSYLYIRSINSTDRTTLERHGAGLITTKRDKELHGYGTRIIAKLAEKYNGCADYRLEDGMFVAQVMMDMTGGEIHHED